MPTIRNKEQLSLSMVYCKDPVIKKIWRRGKPALCAAEALTEPKKVSSVLLDPDVMLLAVIYN